MTLLHLLLMLKKFVVFNEWDTNFSGKKYVQSLRDKGTRKKKKPMRCSQEKFVAEQLGQEIYLRVYNETMS